MLIHCAILAPQRGLTEESEHSWQNKYGIKTLLLFAQPYHFHDDTPRENLRVAFQSDSRSNNSWTYSFLSLFMCQDHETRCCVIDSVIFMMDAPRDSLRMAFGLVDLVDLDL